MPTTIDHSTAESAWIPAAFIAQCKNSCRVDPLIADEDLPVRFTDLVPAAIAMVEDIQWRVIQPKSLTASLDRDLIPQCLNEDRIWLPYGRLHADSMVVSIIDVDSDDVIVPSDDLTIHLATDPAWFRFNADEYDSWQDLFDTYDISDSHPAPVTIEWTAGYTSFDHVPSTTKTAIELAVKHLYYNPESVGDLPESVKLWARMNALVNREPQRLLL